MKEQRNQRVKYLSLSLIGFINIVPTISRGMQVSQLLVVSGFRGIKARRSCSSESEKLLLTKGAGVGLGEDGSRIAWRGWSSFVRRFESDGWLVAIVGQSFGSTGGYFRF